MTNPHLIRLQVTFRDLEQSEALESRIREQVDKVGQFYTGINSCRVTVEKLHKHHQQGHVKHHTQRPHGHITEISPDKRFGRIESADDRWLYFHRNSLIGEDLDKLQEGTAVYYIEDMGDEGPHASSVYPVGKHHILV